MQTFVQSCTAGCGRTRTINLPDGAPATSGTYLCGVDAKPLRDAEEAQRDADRIVAETLARRAQLKNDLEAIKANNPAWWASVIGI